MARQFQIPSSQEGIQELETFIDEYFEKNKKLPEELYGNVLVAVSEAVMNAVVHGNKKDQSLKVGVTVEESDKEISISIEDQGSGFDYENLPDPTHPDNIDKIDGRGIFLMKQLSDDVEFENNGALVKLKFSINPVVA